MKTIAALEAAGLTAAQDRAALEEVAARYAVAMTPEMAALIGSADDGISTQFVPNVRERIVLPEELADPIGDGAHEAVPGVVHRYPDRVLLKAIHACPVYCRFCFRREMVGPGGEALTGAALTRAIDYIAGDARIWEVILTGGDPFMLSTRRTSEIVTRLSGIAHVRVLRWHTRVPLVDPGRVTEDFVRALSDTDRAVFVGLHANHPREFTDAGRAALARLRRTGVSLVSQTVLLKGVNDDLDTLEVLMRAFVENGVKPYYLHHPDLAPGTSHFRLSIADGQALMRGLHKRVSGLAVPAYVLDIPGGVSKAPLGPSYVEEGRVLGDDGVWYAV
jgi:lysine 2,3-aminomutase